nr:DUF4172 domain-containing protein [Brucella intermedia]
MPWNWTQYDWPHFRYDASALAALEQRFLLSSGEVIGAVRHIDPDDRDRLRIELTVSSQPSSFADDFERIID